MNSVIRLRTKGHTGHTEVASAPDSHPGFPRANGRPLFQRQMYLSDPDNFWKLSGEEES